MRPLTRYLVAVGFVAIITVPLLATLAGVSPASLENRAPTVAPSFTGAALLQESTYQQLNRYFVEQFALRGLAVRANARINDTVWRIEAGDVRRGIDDWLFYGPSLRRLCTELLDVGSAAAVLDRFADAVIGSGRRFVYALAPEKSSMYPEQLTDRSREEGRCAFAARDELRATLETRSWYVDLYRALEDLKAVEDEPIYHRRDTHWNRRGAARYVEGVVEHLSPGIWVPADLQPAGTSELVPDLTRLLGLPRTETQEDFSLRRPGVTVVEAAPEPVEGVEFPIRRFAATASGPAPLVPGPTLVVYDSFSVGAIDLLAPFFAESTFIHWNAIGPVDVADLVAAADLVVLQGAEREFTWRMGDKLAGSGLVDEVAADLPRRR